MTRLSRVTCVIFLSIFGRSACGGGGSAAPASPLPPPPVIDPPPPTDPTSTSEWAALVTRLDIRFTTDRNNLIAEQAGAPGPLDGNYYRAARDRFTGRVDAFWDYAFNETVSWSNSSSVTFRQADVAVLLDDSRLQWLTFLDEFIDSLPGNPGGNVINDIRAVMLSSIDDGYENTLRLLEAFLIQSIAPAELSKVRGSWTTNLNDLSFTIQPNGQILGYDYRGCTYEGVLIASRWLQSVFRIIVKEECGTDISLLSGTVLFSIAEDHQALVLYASSAKGVIDRDLSR